MFYTEDYCEEKLENLDAKVADLNNLKNKKEELENRVEYIKNTLFIRKKKHDFNYVFLIFAVLMNTIWFKSHYVNPLDGYQFFLPFSLFVDFYVTGMIYGMITLFDKEKIDKYEETHEKIEKTVSKELLLEESEKLSIELNDVNKLYALKEHNLDIAKEINEKKKKFEEARNAYTSLRNRIDKSLACYYWKQEHKNAYINIVNEEFNKFMKDDICSCTIENKVLGENELTEIHETITLSLHKK